MANCKNKAVFTACAECNRGFYAEPVYAAACDNQQRIRKQARQTAREKSSVKDAVAFLPEYC